MLRQTEIIFPVHQIENNPESSETLEIKRKDFEGQNKRLYDLLMSGKRLTYMTKEQIEYNKKNYEPKNK